MLNTRKLNTSKSSDNVIKLNAKRVLGLKNTQNIKSPKPILINDDRNAISRLQDPQRKQEQLFQGLTEQTSYHRQEQEFELQDQELVQNKSKKKAKAEVKPDPNEHHLPDQTENMSTDRDYAKDDKHYINREVVVPKDEIDHLLYEKYQYQPPNEELQQQLTERIDAPNYQRNFSNLKKSRNEVLWTELSNQNEHVLNRVKRKPLAHAKSYSSLLHHKTVEPVTLTPMSKSLMKGNFKLTSSKKKIDVEKFKKEQEALTQRQYQQKIALKKKVVDETDEEIRLDLEYNNALLNLRMRIEDLEPSIERLYDPEGRISQMRQFATKSEINNENAESEVDPEKAEEENNEGEEPIPKEEGEGAEEENKEGCEEEENPMTATETSGLGMSKEEFKFRQGFYPDSHEDNFRKTETNKAIFKMKQADARADTTKYIWQRLYDNNYYQKSVICNLLKIDPEEALDEDIQKNIQNMRSNSESPQPILNPLDKISQDKAKVEKQQMLKAEQENKRRIEANQYSNFSNLKTVKQVREEKEKLRVNQPGALKNSPVEQMGLSSRQKIDSKYFRNFSNLELADEIERQMKGKQVPATDYVNPDSENWELKRKEWRDQRTLNQRKRLELLNSKIQQGNQFALTQSHNYKFKTKANQKEEKEPLDTEDVELLENREYNNISRLYNQKRFQKKFKEYDEIGIEEGANAEENKQNTAKRTENQEQNKLLMREN